MNLETLGKRLKRELFKNPKKTAALGLLAVVALWFWAPLVWGWLPFGESKLEAAPSPPVVAQTDAAIPVASTPTVKTVGKKHSWQDMTRWIEQDNRMVSAILPDAVRNPFCFSDAQQKQMDEEVDQEQEEAAEITPKDLGMVLVSTIIGPKARYAKISGVLYAQGDLVSVKGAGDSEEPGASTKRADGQADQLAYKLVEIQPEYVVLVRNEKKYELKLQRGGLTGSDRIIVDNRSQPDN